MIELSIDRYDLQLLAALQHDGHATNAGLGEAASLSASQVSRRIQRLEEAKVITGYAALLDPHALGLGVTAYAQVILERHDKTRPAEFEKQIATGSPSPGHPWRQAGSQGRAQTRPSTPGKTLSSRLMR